ncbi:toast rack family protein [Clostridium sp. MB40-C1]|uniref:toast rack family protein n=1 Tax=Clostridium sp. MB40-C1 TaxID=3070996 RepID=UPI0027E18C03|nr:toast rack family protein [Clostridium sp. MB40-C1]WMJ80013.1 toast rack family protein [Clostridium sp. MB40-C1]
MIIKKFLIYFTMYMLTACNLMGCGIGIDKNDSLDNKSYINEKKIIELNGAKQAKVDINMGTGELSIKSGEKKFMESEFLYKLPEWKPNIEYEVNNKEGKLKIYQPSSHNTNAKDNKYKWNLAFNKDVPIDMNIEGGAVEGHIDLSKLNLNKLFIATGVSDMDIDLSGDYKQNIKAEIEGGVGSLKIYLPKNIGVKVNAGKGVGRIKVDGLKKDQDEYVNESYGKTKNNIYLNIGVGVGEVEIKVK